MHSTGEKLLPVLLVLNGLSISGCMWVSWLLRNADESVRRRVFIKQLRSLLLSGSVQHAFFVPLLIVDFSSVSSFMSLRQRDRTCFWSYFGFRHFRMISMLQEWLIALTFLAQALRMHKLGPFLTRSIVLAWILGLTAGLVDDVAAPWYFARGAGRCEMERPDRVTLVLMASTFITAFFSYVFSCVKAWCIGAPQSVVRRNFSRAAVYPFNFVVCYGLVLVAYVDPALFDDKDFLLVACCLESCGGILNSSAYLWQSRRARAAIKRASHASLMNAEGAATGGRDCSSCHDNIISFTVAIGGVDIIEVAPLSREARRRAESQIEAISSPQSSRSPRNSRSNGGDISFNLC